MKTAYFDCFSGASGDMIVGALFDAGLKLDDLRDGLASLQLGGYSLHAQQTQRAGFAATKFDVQIDDSHDHPHRRLGDITAMIDASDLSANVKRRACAVFQRLALAEAGVHGSDIESVHFHEVGAVDSIVDMVGAVLGLELLGVERVACSPMRTGTGTIKCAHGLLPVPAPATARLLVGFPVEPTDVKGELTTPTGAAILTTLACGFGPMPTMTVGALGLGAGHADREDRANVLRVFIGEEQGATCGDTVVQLETNIDDMSPEMFTHLGDLLLGAGARDYYYCPVQMKKSRPGVLISVLASPHKAAAVERVLLEHTTTFGVRKAVLSRSCMRREIVRVDTPFGSVDVKVGYLDGKAVRHSPEYESCRKAAEAYNVSVSEVFEAARRAAGEAGG